MIYMAFLFLTFLILAFAFYQWQHFMVFSPTYHREGELDEKYETLSITTNDGIELEGIIYKSPNATKTLLFFGGRSHDSVGLIQKLSATYPNQRIITFNYRSYGRSGGVVNEKNILSDGVFIADIIQKNYGDFYILGFSIGSNVGAYVASKRSVLGLFLVASFDSVASLANEKFSNNNLFSKLMRYKFRTMEFVKEVDCKTYLFVSKSDEVTYIQNARNLKDHIKNLAYYEELDYVSHKEILWNPHVVQTINKALC